MRGKFTEFECTLEIKEELADCQAHGSVKVGSIDTGEAQRDDHLRSPGFFNFEEFPEITFVSTHVEAIDDESSRVHGNVTMNSTTREIRLDVLIQGTDTDPWDNTRAGLALVVPRNRRSRSAAVRAIDNSALRSRRESSHRWPAYR